MNDPANAGSKELMSQLLCQPQNSAYPRPVGSFLRKNPGEESGNVIYAKIRLRQLKLKVKSKKSKLNSLLHF